MTSHRVRCDVWSEYVVLQVSNVEVKAILNDTSGCLLAGSYLDKECKIAVIMGESL